MQPNALVSKEGRLVHMYHAIQCTGLQRGKTGTHAPCNPMHWSPKREDWYTCIMQSNALVSKEGRLVHMHHAIQCSGLQRGKTGTHVSCNPMHWSPKREDWYTCIMQSNALVSKEGRLVHMHHAIQCIGLQRGKTGTHVSCNSMHWSPKREDWYTCIMQSNALISKEGRLVHMYHAIQCTGLQREKTGTHVSCNPMHWSPKREDLYTCIMQSNVQVSKEGRLVHMYHAIQCTGLQRGKTGTRVSCNPMHWSPKREDWYTCIMQSNALVSKEGRLVHMYHAIQCTGLQRGKTGTHVSCNSMHWSPKREDWYTCTMQSNALVSKEGRLVHMYHAIQCTGLQRGKTGTHVSCNPMHWFPKREDWYTCIMQSNALVSKEGRLVHMYHAIQCTGLQRGKTGTHVSCNPMHWSPKREDWYTCIMQSNALVSKEGRLVHMYHAIQCIGLQKWKTGTHVSCNPMHWSPKREDWYTCIMQSNALVSKEGRQVHMYHAIQCIGLQRGKTGTHVSCNPMHWSPKREDWYICIMQSNALVSKEGRLLHIISICCSL